jgi:hypothetical protein
MKENFVNSSRNYWLHVHVSPPCIALSIDMFGSISRHSAISTPLHFSYFFFVFDFQLCWLDFIEEILLVKINIWYIKLVSYEFYILHKTIRNMLFWIYSTIYQFDMWGSGLKLDLFIPLHVVGRDWMEWSLGLHLKNQNSVSQKLWHYKDPSMIYITVLSPKHRSKFCISSLAIVMFPYERKILKTDIIQWKIIQCQ